MKTSRPNITTLSKGEVFVFGSNLAGAHGAGAARLAHDRFGAVAGRGTGLHGRSYAIPTKGYNIETLDLGTIADYIGGFLRFAKEHPQYEFLVTQIGCGLTGYKPSDIAPLFFRYEMPPNVALPEEFWRYRETKGG